MAGVYPGVRQTLDLQVLDPLLIELKEGEYVYSCPLNPTPDYKLIVTS